MGETVWADRPDGGQVPFDPDACKRFPLRVDDWPKSYLYLRPESDDDRWIYAEKEPTSWRRSGPNARLLPVRFAYLRCRVVTPKEADEMRRGAGSDNPPQTPIKPKWDPENRILSVEGSVCRKFARRADNQIKILAKLQAEGWPEKSIRNPLRDEAQLRQTIKDFNKSLTKDCPFRLVQDLNRVGWTLGPDMTDLP
jgi:hypothetical protein